MNGAAQPTRTGAEPTIWLVGPLPPPLHGQAVYNAAIAEYLQRLGRLRLLPSGAGVAGKLAGYGRMLVAALIRMRRADVVYLSMPGQSAAWLFALVVAALRLRGIRHFVHHHSFRPIAAGPLRVIRLVVALGGRHQHHILLSPGMRDRFAAIYLAPADRARAHALSNALLFCPPAAKAAPRPPRPVTIGHLSVLTRAKGVDTLLRVFRLAASRYPDWRLVIAGPVADNALSGDLAAAIADFPGRVDYRGPLAGEAKRAFWADIDLFVLPTRLVDEAEPLVMLEGYAAGVEFIATPRGCIPERIRRPDRLLGDDDETDLARIAAVVSEGANDWAALREACVGQAVALHRLADTEAQRLFAVMLDGA